jgi:hypothetical protein
VSSLTLGKFRAKIGFNLEKPFNNPSNPKNSGMVGGSESFFLYSPFSPSFPISSNHYSTTQNMIKSM